MDRAPGAFKQTVPRILGFQNSEESKSAIHAGSTRPSRALLRHSFGFLLLSARRRRITELPSEIALDGLHLFVLEAEIIHVAERFAVLGPAKILHKRFAVVSDHPL